MALAYLTGDPNSLAAGNWDDGVGPTGAGTGKTSVIPDGKNTITTSVDLSGAGRSTSFQIMRPFSGGIGTSAAPLKIIITDSTAAEKDSANTEGFFQYFAGGGYCFLAAAGTTSGTNSIDNLFQNSPSASLTLVSGLFVYSHIESGTLNILADAVLTNMDIYGGSITTTAQTTPTNFTTINIWGGAFTMKRTATTVNQYGGSVTYDYETVSGGTTTTWNLNGGTLTHRAGDIGTLNHNTGAVHDATSIRRGSTIGTCIRKPGSRFSGRRSGDLLTITTDKTIGMPTT